MFDPQARNVPAGRAERVAPPLSNALMREAA